jgi:hypothetical protein
MNYAQRLVFVERIPRIKRQRREAQYLPSLSADANNNGAVLPLPTTSSWRDAYETPL